MNNIEINKFLIEDVSFTLRNFAEKINEWESASYWERQGKENPYVEAAHAMLIVAKIGFGDCFPINQFIDCVRTGCFIDYDGVGYFVDVNGNEISPIRCNVDWLHTNTPKDAKFIMWYNK